MNRAIILLACILLFTTANAQDLLVETFYLKNGSVITGTVVEYVPNRTYTIVTSTGDKFVFDIEDIEKVTRGTESKSQQKLAKSVNSLDLFKKGNHSLIEAGAGFGNRKYGINIFKADFVNGHRFNEKLFVGLGVGVRLTFDEDFPAIVPLFINGRYNFKVNKPISPMASLSAGTVFNTLDGFNNGGLMINPSFGFLFNQDGNYLFHLSLGYDVMHVTFVKELYKSPYTYSIPTIVRNVRLSEAFVFNLGVSF